MFIIMIVNVPCLTKWLYVYITNLFHPMLPPANIFQPLSLPKPTSLETMLVFYANITSHHAHLCCRTKPWYPSRPHQRIQSPCCVLHFRKKPRSSTDISKHQVRAVTVKQQYTCLHRYHLTTTMEAKRSSLLPPDYVIPLMDCLLPSPVKPSAAGNHPLSLPSNSCPLQSNQALPVIVLCHFRHNDCRQSSCKGHY